MKLGCLGVPPLQSDRVLPGGTVEWYKRAGRQEVLLYLTADPTTINPNGPLMIILLLGVILSVPVSVGLIWLYRRAVLKSMRTRVTSRVPETPQVVSSTPHDPSREAPPELVIFDSAADTPATPAAKDLC